MGIQRKRPAPGGPKTIQDWLQVLPGRTWNPDITQWVVTDPGPDADRVFRDLGFTVDLSKGAALGIAHVADLASPMFEIDTDDAYVTWLYPRFSTGTVQLPVGVWDKDKRAFAIYTPDLARPDLIDPLHEVPIDIVDQARQLRKSRTPYGDPERDAKLGAYLATEVSRTKRRSPKALAVAAERFGVLPDWFGMTPFGYQEIGAYGVLSCHTLLADSRGLGKTLQSVAAHQLAGTQRLLVVCPQKARPAWARTFEATHVAYRDSAKPGRADAGGVVVFSPGRKKLPDLPPVGAVIISDSLLASNAEIREAIIAWKPDGMAVDEGHRMKGWGSARSRIVRAMAQRVPGLTVVATGTPLLSSPHDLAGLLAITGHLDSVFGGYTQFMTRYSYRTPMGKWVARKRRLPELRQVLDGQVWVRRNRDEAYAELEEETEGEFKAPKFAVPQPMWVDVPMKPFTDAHTEVVAHIDEWLDDLGRKPTPDEIKTWASDNIGLLSPLRKGAGLAKVPAAAEYVQDWVANARADMGDSDEWNDPLIVWTHHHEVTEAMIAAVKKVDAPVAEIWGGSKGSATEKTEDDFQAGKTAVLVASIHAAGTALTLTRAAAALFVETDWTPANIQQASDRIQRIGQTRPTSLTMMVAEGTLDERIQQSLADKAAVLEPLLDEGSEVSVLNSESALTATDIVVELITSRVKASRRPHDRSRAA